LLTNNLTQIAAKGEIPWILILPLLLAVTMAWRDLRTRRIPNCLTLGAALAGLGFRLGYYGWSGLTSGCVGLVLGFGLLICFYLMGGMGAGDVKALAALGAWLGPWPTFMLFLYMAMVGGLMAIGVLWWKGLLWSRIRQRWTILVNWALFRPYRLEERVEGRTAPSPAPKTEGIPYAVALALGMLILVVIGG
jgi:prepilin peptidase CpaA